MIEGLWTVIFKSDSGEQGTGVVIFESEKISGGDSQYYYLGRYEIKNERISGQIEVNHFGNEPLSIFGPAKNFQLRISGLVDEKTMTLEGHVKDAPQMQIRIICKKRS